MSEVQLHGFDFENWVKNKFFAEIKVLYSEKWDIPKEANFLKAVPKSLRNLPVSVKTCKNKSSISFADVFRKFSVNEHFLLIVGFWEQKEDYKNYVAVEAIKVLAEEWRKLFVPLTRANLLSLDAVIKNKELNCEQARKMAKETKKSLPKSIITLNPKIQVNQHRLQCSLRYKLFWELIAKKQSYRNVECSLFGERVPNPFVSGARVFKPKIKPD